MDSENTWTPKKNRLSQSEYAIIAHQSIRKIAEDHSEYEIFAHQTNCKLATSVAMASIFNGEQEFRSRIICCIKRAI